MSPHEPVLDSWGFWPTHISVFQLTCFSNIKLNPEIEWKDSEAFKLKNTYNININDWFDIVPVDDISKHVDATSNDERKWVTGGREVDHVPGEEAGEEGEGDVGGDD